MAKDAVSSVRYTDQQIIAATGMPVDSLRRLITWGAVRPAQSGGGRGRVRLWTTRQALRISVTAQFASAGFSLQMAHSLTYCIPLDQLLSLYDPETLTIALADRRRRKGNDADGNDLLDVLTTRKQPKIWPIPGQYEGSETIIVDGRFLYSDAYGDTPTLMAEIDNERQRVVPYSDPLRATFYDEALERESSSDVVQIDKGSLLIDRKYLGPKGRKALFDNALPAPSQVDSNLLCKSRLSINLALGFVLCVRALRGLPTTYSPCEFDYREG
jgi:hypothetical protein